MVRGLFSYQTEGTIIKEESWRQSTELLIFDELHKMPGWKNYLKGIFDTKIEHLKILVTGSARLDMFRQTGDSLAGRFFTHRLMPFSISELKEDALSNNIERFIQRGGFPEPFLTVAEIFHIPAVHDRALQVALAQDSLSIDDILRIDCEILKQQGLLLLYMPDKHISKGMEVERAFAIKNNITSLAFDGNEESIKNIEVCLRDYT